MVNKIICILLILFSAFNLRGQEVDFGPKFGANFATLGDLERLDNQIGFVGGLFLNIKFEKFGIQPELFYSQQGEQFNLSSFDTDYINLPLMFKFYLIGGFNFQLGPQFGILINDNIPDGILESFQAETYALAGVAGLGIDLPLKINLSARYVFDVQNDLESADFENGFLTLAIGLRLF